MLPSQLPTQRIMKPFVFNITLVVLLFLSGIFIGIIVRNKSLLENTALVSTRAYFNQIILTRSWSASYGGVYVEKKPGMQSNPYLLNPDMTSSDGRIYTNKNPALMTREISEIAEKRGLFKFHITSLKPLNPGNKPDDFESAALLKLEKGEKEISTVVKINDKYFFRYMGPLVTEKSCLACHAVQGYKEGDIRGGISVTYDISEIKKATLLYSWIILILGAVVAALIIGIIFFLIRNLMGKLNHAYTVINELAIKDELTGLFNRRYFFTRFEDECLRTQRYGSTAAVMMVDADFFKAVNDTFGHAAGDLVLKKISEILKESMRSTDILARYGGEEFVAYLVNTDGAGALAVGEKIRREAELSSVHTPDGKDIRFTLSIGLAEITPQKLLSVGNKEEILKKADDALYRAKREGRNRVIINDE